MSYGNGLSSIACPQFVKNAIDVGLYGACAAAHTVGDFFRREALSHVAQGQQFPRAQRWVCHGLWLRYAQQYPLAAHDAIDRVEQIVAAYVLQNVAADASVQSCLYYSGVGECTEHNDTRSLVSITEDVGHHQAFHLRQAYIQQE